MTPKQQAILDETNRLNRLPSKNPKTLAASSTSRMHMSTRDVPRLRDRTAMLRTQPHSAHGLVLLQDQHFDSNRAARMISGVVVSSREPNSHGDSYIASGLVKMKSPIPLLLRHKLLIGRVTYLRAVGECVRFSAEIANAGLQLADDVWEDLVDRRLDCASMQAVNCQRSSTDVVTHFEIEEISVVLNGADGAAAVDRCYERLPGEPLLPGLRAPTKEHWSGPIRADFGYAAHPFALHPRKSDRDERQRPAYYEFTVAAQRRAELSRLKKKVR